MTPTVESLRINYKERDVVDFTNHDGTIQTGFVTKITTLSVWVATRDRRSIKLKKSRILGLSAERAIGNSIKELREM